MSKNHRQRVGQNYPPTRFLVLSFSHPRPVPLPAGSNPWQFTFLPLPPGRISYWPSTLNDRPSTNQLLLSMPANLAQNPPACPSRFASFARSARKKERTKTSKKQAKMAPKVKTHPQAHPPKSVGWWPCANTSVEP